MVIAALNGQADNDAVMAASKSSTALSTAPAASPAGIILRQWRGRRGWSQLDLANEARASQRHVSFIESGRGRASRGLLIALAEALGMPLRERNALLLAAGFAPIYADTAWGSTESAVEMGPVKKALERMLRQHAPFPAIVMDRHWNVLMSNDDAPRFFGSFIDMAARKGQRNLLRLMFDPQGMRPHIDNWEQVARGLFERMRREAVGGKLDDEAQRLIAELQATSGFTPDWERADALPGGPVLPIGFIKGSRVLNYFSMVSTVGTPQTVTAQELRVECMFPADDATETWHLAHFGVGRLPTS